jgi:hypothetical protein
VAVRIVIRFEIVDIDHQQGQRLALAQRTRPFGVERLVEAAAVRQACEAVARGQLFEGDLGQLFVRHVAQRLDDGSEPAALVVDRARVRRQVAPAAHARHVAPALGGQVRIVGKADAGLVRLGGAFFEEEVGERGTALFEKTAPVLARADDVARRDARQAFARAVPQDHAGRRIEHENGNGQRLHQLVGENAIGRRARGIHEPLYCCCACHEASFGSNEQLIANENRLCATDNGAPLIFSKGGWRASSGLVRVGDDRLGHAVDAGTQ